MHTALKSQAISLRQRGWLYSEIAKELGIAKSTAHSWTANAQLDQRTLEDISKKYNELRRLSVEKMALANKQRREKRDLAIYGQARAIVSNATLSLNQKRIICSSLFWCEGTKNVDSGVKFINSDPTMIQTFLKLLRESFDIDESKFRALVHLHEYHDQNKQLNFWSNITKIPLAQFHKTHLKEHSTTNVRKGYPGCISIRYLDSSLGKLLKMIYIEFSHNLIGVYVNW